MKLHHNTPIQNRRRCALSPGMRRTHEPVGICRSKSREDWLMVVCTCDPLLLHIAASGPRLCTASARARHRVIFSDHVRVTCLLRMIRPSVHDCCGQRLQCQNSKSGKPSDEDQLMLLHAWSGTKQLTFAACRTCLGQATPNFAWVQSSMASQCNIFLPARALFEHLQIAHSANPLAFGIPRRLQCRHTRMTNNIKT